MKKLTLSLFLIAALLLVVSCGTSNATVAEEPVVEQAPVAEAPVVQETEVVEDSAPAAEGKRYIPVQSGLEDGIKYQLLGTMPSPIGDANVTCNLAADGTYEVSMAIGPYTSSASWGTWEYDMNNDVFVLTDTDNALNLKSTRDGDTYSIVVPFRDTEITVSATITERKEYVPPMAPAQSGLEDGVEYKLLGTMPSPIGDATVTCALATNGTYEVSMAIGPYTSSASWGTWAYDVDNDAFVLTDTDNALNLTSTKEGDTYTIVVPFRDTTISVSAEMTEKKAYVAKTAAASQAEEVAKVERLGVEVVHLELKAVEDRYSSYDQAKWDELWRDDSYEVQTYDKKDYGATQYDSLFEHTLSKDDYKLVSEDQRGSIDKVYYDTTLYEFYMANGIPEEEWVPNR
jgi:hypothetical protein